jgi:predicted lipoprotein with Yx(FWY)xxD motif
MQTKPFVPSALAAITLVAFACGGTTGSSSTSPSPATSGTTIAVATNAKFGQILVDGKGITVYLFLQDTGTASTCYTNCAAIWPPVLTDGAPQAGSGSQASLLGTTTRTDGKVELTYAGHPLYYFIKDKAVGDTTGQGINGFGALWWVMSPAGAAITIK